MASILSSTENTMFRREKYMDSVPSQVYGETPWVDPLDPRILALVNKATSLGIIEFKGQVITTLSQQVYGTTSLWWLIVMYNGFLFADEIPYGTKLKIPSLASITKDIRPGQPSKSRRGTVVKA